MDDESARQRSNSRKGTYADYVKEDGTTVYGRYKDENQEQEREIFERPKKGVEEAEAEVEPGKMMSGTKLSQTLIDYFIENDLPWQWKSAGIVR